METPNPEAYFECMLCLQLPEQEVRFFEGRVYGHLTFPPRGPEGFGYDPIFTPNDHTATFGEMSSEQKHKISHRARAMASLVEFLQKRS